MKRDLVRKILEVRDVALLALLEEADLLSLPGEFQAFLGEKCGRAATRFAHHPTDLAPLYPRQSPGAEVGETLAETYHEVVLTLKQDSEMRKMSRNLELPQKHYKQVILVYIGVEELVANPFVRLGKL